MEIPGPESRRLMEQAAHQEGPAAARQPSIAWKRAEGVHVEDVDGNLFLDFTSSVLVAAVGHRHPKVVEAITEQAGELLHSYNFVNPWRVELGRRLLQVAAPHELDRVFIATTGAEVVELALKLARWKSGKSGTVALDGGYHGKTIAATAVGGKAESRAGLGDLLPGIVHLPFPMAGRADSQEAERRALAALDQVDGSRVGTVIIEALQGNAGQRGTSGEFLHALQDFARLNGAVFIIDETQSAFGRAGSWFSFEQFGLRPDLVIAGKGISSSLPLTVLLGRADVVDAAPPGSLSSTHGGNPMACRAACVVLDLLESEQLLANSAEVGAYLLGGIREAITRAGIQAEARGTGLMIGIEILDGAGEPDPVRARLAVEAAWRRGLLVLAPIGLKKNVVRVSPPLVLTREQAAEGIAILGEAFAEAA